MRCGNTISKIVTCMIVTVILLSANMVTAQSLTAFSGTVVDPSGNAIAGATLRIQSRGGSERATQSDGSGLFTFSGLAAGDYRLTISSKDFRSREMSVTVRTAGTPPLHISLAVNDVNTTVNVQGRADDLIGIASSAGQVTVGAE